MNMFLPVEWIPSESAILSADPDFVVPVDHFGSNSHPRLAELFVSRYGKVQVKVGHVSHLNELFLNLSAVYSPGMSLGLFYTHCLKDKSIDSEKVVEILYLHTFYPNAVTPLVALFDSLKQSFITGLNSNYVLPDYGKIGKFLATREWFLDENFNPPLDFTWNVSQYWDRENITVTLREINGDISKIVDLLKTGASPDIVKAQILGESSPIPQSWLKSMLDFYETDKEENKS